ncbi:hypothetical protein [Sphingomicrobium sediminis]|uniref:Lipoprotein n=1 Tax=Sphingomicrobium sediminis TaxID=2950949 RepID=A0A9X2J1U7_9SPHN|nr:hypothetical protein [Sphingomicrobium sediminis]MCM8556360.1 hypothetical protein [Sphingomicrobium sediminis]
MRYLVGVAALALTACSGEAPSEPMEAPIEAGVWIDGAQSGLCIGDGGEAAFILYGDEGEANCMAEGRVNRLAGDGALAFVPRGDEQCRIGLHEEGDTITLGSGGSAACSYYCGGDVTLEDRSLSRSDATDRALVDPAGDSIC